VRTERDDVWIAFTGMVSTTTSLGARAGDVHIQLDVDDFILEAHPVEKYADATRTKKEHI
jgi:hypothetical protein